MNVIRSNRTKLSANKKELKNALAKMITNLINNKKWSDKVAAEEFEVEPSMITELSKGLLKNISLEDILDLFVKLGYKTEIKPSSHKDLMNVIIKKKRE
jgi:predicted XRE-type DNA-binding protein